MKTIESSLLTSYDDQAACGLTVGALKPSNPAIFPTPGAVFDSIVKTESDMACCVPAFVEVSISCYCDYKEIPD